MLEINFNKQKQAMVIRIEVQPPIQEGERLLSKRERIGRAFQMAHDELQKAWALAVQDNDALDAELAQKTSDVTLRKSQKIEIDVGV